MGSRSRRATEGCHDRAEQRRVVFANQYNSTPSNFMPPVPLEKARRVNSTWPQLQSHCAAWIRAENKRRKGEGYPADMLIPWPVK